MQTGGCAKCKQPFEIAKDRCFDRLLFKKTLVCRVKATQAPSTQEELKSTHFAPWIIPPHSKATVVENKDETTHTSVWWPQPERKIVAFEFGPPENKTKFECCFGGRKYYAPAHFSHTYLLSHISRYYSWGGRDGVEKRNPWEANNGDDPWFQEAFF